jgi:hypothetical protein
MDGDMTVPFCTASARLVNRYALNRTWVHFINTSGGACFAVAGHSGFADAEREVLGLPAQTAYDVPSAEEELTGRVGDGGWATDTERMVHTKEELVRSICSPAVPEGGPVGPFWRRVDFQFAAPTWSLIRVHDMPIGKLQFPGDRPASDAAMTFISRLVEADTR